MVEVLKGTPASPGRASGVVEHHEGPQRRRPRRRIHPTEVATERARFDGAIANVVDVLDASEDHLGGGRGAAHRALASALVETHRALLVDPLLIDAVRSRIGERRLCAEWALKQVLDDLRCDFESLDRPALRDWWRDVEGLAATLFDALCDGGVDSTWSTRQGAVIVARQVTVTDVIAFDRAAVSALVLEEGSLTSHVAVLCRSAGLPAVVGVAGARERIEAGAWVEVDGDTGAVRLRTEGDSAPKAATPQARLALDHAHSGTEWTRDGQPITLRANLDLRLDAAFAITHGVRGVGLLRSCYHYLGRRDLPGVDELAALYGEVVADFAPDPVTIRLLDLGGPFGSNELPDGLHGLGDSRGVRLLASHPEIYETQVRAMWRAATAGRLRILVPFVSDAGEIAAVRTLLADCKDVLTPAERANTTVEVGAMIELPAAVMLVEEIAEAVDFLAIGSNDLTHHLLAISRDQPGARHDQAPHASLLESIRRVVAAGKERGIDVCLCGELASDPRATELLLRTGLRELSMAPRLAPQVRAAIAASSALGDIQS